MTQPKHRTFTELVQNDGDLVGMIAYAMYKKQKLNWTMAYEENYGCYPSREELDKFNLITNKPENLSDYKNNAEYLFNKLFQELLADRIKAIQEQLHEEMTIQMCKDIIEKVQENERKVIKKIEGSEEKVFKEIEGSEEKVIKKIEGSEEKVFKEIKESEENVIKTLKVNFFIPILQSIIASILLIALSVIFFLSQAKDNSRIMELLFNPNSSKVQNNSK